MTGVSLDIEQSVTQLTEGLEGKEREIRRATSRAYNGFATWAERQVMEILCRDSSIPLDVLKRNKRVFLKKKRSAYGELTNIWIGLNPLPVAEIGKATRSGDGVSVAGLGFFPKAFITTLHDGQPVRRTGRGRYAFSPVKHEFSSQVLAGLRTFGAKAMPKFEELMRKELEFALNE